MTELEPYRPSTLQAWSDDAQAAALVAQAIAPTPFCPASLRDREGLTATVANITAALLTGQELGLGPMASLRSIDIVNGTPALRAVALRALVQQAGHDMWVEESTKTRAIVKGHRKDSDKVQESVWTIDRAKDLGLTGRDNWRKQPGAMLVARASAELARLVAADAILGLPYIAEELEDGDPVETVETVVQKPARRTAQRRLKAAEPVAEPDEPSTDDHEADSAIKGVHDDRIALARGIDINEPPTVGPRPVVDVPLPDDEPPLDEPTPGHITDAQAKMMHGLFRQLGIADRDDRLAMSEGYVGRPLTSSKELTVAEASLVIDELNRLPFDEPDDAG